MTSRTDCRRILLTDNGQLTRSWPFTRDRLEQRLGDVAEVVHVDVSSRELTDLDWENYDAAILFNGQLSEAMLDRASRLQLVAGMSDVKGPTCFESLCRRGIPYVDATSAWGQSVAECGFGLILCALRKLPQWHMRLVNASFDWNYPYEQFCDDPDFVNGELGTKTVGVIGLGQIGSRIAHWCTTFGATVLAHDPFAPEDRFTAAGAQSCEVDALIARVDILVIAVPPSPSAVNLVDATRVNRLARGSIVLTITRAAAIDVAALRQRVLANELLWAADVYDVEPLAHDDPILGRDNVVHVPHIAGRTRDANIRLADTIADDILRVFGGDAPRAALTPQAVAVRTGGQ